jgi:hypothetical protein
LSEGRNTISLVAVDAAGNTAQTSFNLTRDVVPPVLTLEDLPSEVSSDTVIVEGETELGSTIFVNGQFVSSGGGQFSVEVPLNEGSNMITVETVDSAGNSARMVKYVSYVPSQPYEFVAYVLLVVLALLVFFMGYALGNRGGPRKEDIAASDLGQDETPPEDEIDEPEEEMGLEDKAEIDEDGSQARDEKSEKPSEERPKDSKKEDK